jgi:hypothetical protein
MKHGLIGRIRSSHECARPQNGQRRLGSHGEQVVVTSYVNVRLGGQRGGEDPSVISITDLDRAWLLRLRDDLDCAEHRFGGSYALRRKLEFGFQDTPELGQYDFT